MDSIAMEAQGRRAQDPSDGPSDPSLDSWRVVARGDGFSATLRCKALVFGILDGADACGHRRDGFMDCDPLLVGAPVARWGFCDLWSMAENNQEASNH